MQDLATRRETVRRLRPGDYAATPAGHPHLFEFENDSALLEWWDCPYRAWFFKPYRARIDAAAGA